MLLGSGRLREGYHESRRCSRDTYPEPYITKYTSSRRLLLSSLNMPVTFPTDKAPIPTKNPVHVHIGVVGKKIAPVSSHRQFRSRANSANIRQSRPDHGLGVSHSSDQSLLFSERRCDCPQVTFRGLCQLPRKINLTTLRNHAEKNAGNSCRIAELARKRVRKLSETTLHSKHTPAAMTRVSAQTALTLRQRVCRTI